MLMLSKVCHKSSQDSGSVQTEHEHKGLNVANGNNFTRWWRGLLTDPSGKSNSA